MSDGTVLSIIARDTVVPTGRWTVEYSTNIGDQTGVGIAVYQGISSTVEMNSLVGRFELTGFKRMLPEGVAQIKVTMDVDKLGMLSVEAVEEVSGATNIWNSPISHLSKETCTVLVLSELKDMNMFSVFGIFRYRD